jgi:hypothetical protein
MQRCIALLLVAVTLGQFITPLPPGHTLASPQVFGHQTLVPSAIAAFESPNQTVFAFRSNLLFKLKRPVLTAWVLLVPLAQVFAGSDATLFPQGLSTTAIAGVLISMVALATFSGLEGDADAEPITHAQVFQALWSAQLPRQDNQEERVFESRTADRLAPEGVSIDSILEDLVELRLILKEIQPSGPPRYRMTQAASLSYGNVVRGLDQFDAGKVSRDEVKEAFQASMVQSVLENWNKRFVARGGYVGLMSREHTDQTPQGITQVTSRQVEINPYEDAGGSRDLTLLSQLYYVLYGAPFSTFDPDGPPAMATVEDIVTSLAVPEKVESYGNRLLSDESARSLKDALLLSASMGSDWDVQFDARLVEIVWERFPESVTPAALLKPLNLEQRSDRERIHQSLRRLAAMEIVSETGTGDRAQYQLRENVRAANGTPRQAYVRSARLYFLRSYFDNRGTIHRLLRSIWVRMSRVTKAAPPVEILTVPEYPELRVESVNRMRFSFRHGFIYKPYMHIAWRGEPQALETKLQTDPAFVMDLFLLCTKDLLGTGKQVRLSSSLYAAVRRNSSHFSATAVVREKFIELLSSPHNVTHAVWRLHDSGLLAEILPAFRFIQSLRVDPHHALPIDAHSLAVLRWAEEFILPTKLLDFQQDWPILGDLGLVGRRGSVLGAEDRLAMRLAVLFHDTKKEVNPREGRGAHARLAAEAMAEELSGFPIKRETLGTARWLVQNHMIPNSVADAIADPRGETEIPLEISRLHTDSEMKDMHKRLLAVLSLADRLGADPRRWDEIRESLYPRSLQTVFEILGKKSIAEPITELLKRRDIELDDVHDALFRAVARQDDQLRAAGALRSLWDEFVQLFPRAYLVTLGTERTLVYFRFYDALVRQSDMPGVGVLVEGDRVPREERIEFRMGVTKDREGRLADMAGALTAHGFKIETAVAHRDSSGRAVAIFRGAFEGGLPPGQEIENVAKILEMKLARLITSDISIKSVFEENRIPYQFAHAAAVEIEFDPEQSRLRVSAGDYKGFLHVIARALANAYGVYVTRVDVGTLTTRASDLFTLKIKSDNGSDYRHLTEEEARPILEGLNVLLSLPEIGESDFDYLARWRGRWDVLWSDFLKDDTHLRAKDLIERVLSHPAGRNKVTMANILSGLIEIGRDNGDPHRKWAIAQLQNVYDRNDYGLVGPHPADSWRILSIMNLDDFIRYAAEFGHPTILTSTLGVLLKTPDVFAEYLQHMTPIWYSWSAHFSGISEEERAEKYRTLYTNISHDAAEDREEFGFVGSASGLPYLINALNAGDAIFDRLKKHQAWLKDAIARGLLGEVTNEANQNLLRAA